MPDAKQEVVKDGRPQWAKCQWCNRRISLYYDQVDESWHFSVHDWRGGEQCANSHKKVYLYEVDHD